MNKEFGHAYIYTRIRTYIRNHRKLLCVYSYTKCLGFVCNCLSTETCVNLRNSIKF